jgi:hypothetical protein
VAEAGEDVAVGASWAERVRAVVERVAAREARRQGILATIAAQARRRALEVAGWGLERAWPEGRLREAWVVARHGPHGAAQHGAAAAGHLRPETARPTGARRQALRPLRRPSAVPGPRWPRWLRTTPAGEPVFDNHGQLELDPDQRPPAPGSLSYRLVVRDAYLLAGRQPPAEVDGRWEMKLRDEGRLPPSADLATRDVDAELLELARLTTIPLRALQRWTPDRREHELARLRAEQAAAHRAERQAFLDRLAARHLDAEPKQ